MRWVLANLIFLRDDAGRPLSWVGQFLDITARRAQEAALRHMADHDELTGLLNRRAFHQRSSSTSRAGAATARRARS